MLIRMEEYFLCKPERLIRLGSSLAYLGGMLIVFALLGNVAKSAVSALGAIGGHAGTVKTLADIYPSLPTWWIPESIIGVLPAIFMIIAGLILSQFGKRIKYYMKHI